MRKSKVLMSLALATTLSLGMCSFASAEVNQIERIQGSNRYETSSKIAERYGDADTVIIASGENYPDALSATPLANTYKSPILLTEKNKLSDSTKETINKIKPKRIVIVGGVGAVSQNVENELKTIEGSRTIRFGGKNRYETSLKIAREVGTDRGVFLTTGQSYADALSVGSVASSLEIPVILTPKEELPDYIKCYVRNSDKVYIIGGEGIISKNVESGLKNVKRIYGENRYDTNRKILDEFKGNLNMENGMVATGEGFADALAGGALASKTNTPMILVSKNPQGEIDKMPNEIKNLTILGGYGAVDKIQGE